MELILAILALVVGAIVKKLAEEFFREWVPRIVPRLIKRASSELPEDQQEQYEKSCRARIEQVPGEAGKLIIAIQLTFPIIASKFLRNRLSNFHNIFGYINRILVDLKNNESGEGIIDVNSEGHVFFFNDYVMAMFDLKGNINGVYRGILNEDLYEIIVNKIEVEELAILAYSRPYSVTNDKIYFKNGRIVQRTSSTIFDGRGNIIGRRWRFRFIHHHRHHRDRFLFRYTIGCHGTRATLWRT